MIANRTNTSARFENKAGIPKLRQVKERQFMNIVGESRRHVPSD